MLKVFDYKCDPCNLIEERIVEVEAIDSQICECGVKMQRLFTFSKVMSKPDAAAFPKGYWPSAGREINSNLELEAYLDEGKRGGEFTERIAKYKDGYRGKPKRVSLSKNYVRGESASEG